MYEEKENKAIAEIKKYCVKYEISIPELAQYIDVIPIRIYEIINGKRRLTIDTDLRLCKLFGLEDKHFLKFQIEYDYEKTSEKIHEKLSKIKQIIRKKS